jgi:hypothetical protein
MALEYYKRHNNGEPLLIIAPAAKTRSGDWERELEEVYSGESLPDYRIISRERLTVSKHAGRPLWWQFTPRFGGVQYSVIVDEIQIGGRNPSTAFHKKLKYITANAPIFLGLSGTPLPNGWRDFIGYSLLFGFSRTITEFKNRYFQIVRYRGFPEITGYYHTDELDEQWRQVSRHLTRSDAGALLPKRQILPMDFEPSHNELAEYRRIVKERTIERAGEMVPLDTASKLLHAARQSLTKLKLDQLRSIIDDTEENVVIFYNYESEREALLGVLDGKTVYEVNSHAKTAPAKSEWPQTHNSVTLAQYKAASRGIELTYATITVFFGLTYSYEEYSQALGRTYRNGQTEHTLVYCFRVKGTVEEAVWRALRKKSDFNEVLYLEKEM